MAMDDYQKLFLEMPLPRMIVSVSEEGEYILESANKGACDYFEHESPQGAISLSQFLHADDYRHFEQSFEVCMEKKIPVSIQSLPRIPSSVKVYGFYITPVFDEQGGMQYFDIIGQPDTNNQSILQRERDDAISLLSSIFEASEVGIVVTDQNTRIVRVNESFVRIYGWEKDELISTEFHTLVTPDEREYVRASHQQYIETGERNSGEVKIIKKDGTVANTLFTAATLELSQKRRFRVITIMDITLRKNMEQSLRRAKEQADSANRAKSTFLANMSHELRTPLNAIIGFSEMIFGETFGPLGHNKYKEYLGDIVSSARHLLEIINEVLDMSKIEAGKIELDESEMHIGELVNSVARMMDSKAFASDLTIDVQIPDELPTIKADIRLMRQVFINLINNALKFSKQGDTIAVSAEMLENQTLKLLVEDHGYGIPKEKIKHVMQPFGQVVEHAEQQHDRGTGLGLPLAKAMVELHGGELRLESDVGQGTKIYIYLPSSRIINK